MAAHQTKLVMNISTSKTKVMGMCGRNIQRVKIKT
jgi:hypothetical protein